MSVKYPGFELSYS